MSSDQSQSFQGHPMLDYSKSKIRKQVKKELQTVQNSLPFRIQPQLGCEEGDSSLKSVRVYSPNDLSICVSETCYVPASSVDDIVSQSQLAQKKWKVQPVAERVQKIKKLAQILSQKRTELMALIALEVGKPLDEADADVCEAIDFCNYYAESASALFTPQDLSVLGEQNHMQPQALGVVVVIAPWNFPLAILCGMTVAPLLCGNSVIVKPAEQSMAVASKFFDCLIDAGVPVPVAQFVPGLGEDVGQALVKHAQIQGIVFTGSKAVGLQILQQANTLQPGQVHLKRCVVEMGGKNALIVDEDADLDQAITAALASAFGFTGQKCSALSRLLVHEKIFDEFQNRLKESFEALSVGSVLEMAYDIGPVIDLESKQRLESVIQSHKEQILAQIDLPDSSHGHYIQPTLFIEDNPKSDLMHKEFFGPLLTLFKIKSFDEGIQIMNSVEYALTGGVFSRNPQHIVKAQSECEVGNLYINRNITGALVGRQPFGGFKLSGMSGKAGGPNYLGHFVNWKTISENTVRRGFSPEVSV